MLTRLNKNARIVLCGAISAYNSSKPRGLQNYLTLIAQRASIRGFIVYVDITFPLGSSIFMTRDDYRFDYEKDYPQAEAEMSGWIKEGKLKRKYHYEKGLEKCPEHLQLLFNGGNTGKLVVQISKQEAKL